MPSIDQLYRDEKLDKGDKKILKALQGKEERPIKLWKDKVITNKNQLYSKLRELEKTGYIIKRPDPIHNNRYFYTTAYYAPVPRYVGWQRYLLESQMAKYRKAAKLGLHLYYYSIEHMKSHGDRCHSLAEDLGISNFVESIMKSSQNSSPQQAMGLMRNVDNKIREHHDNIVGAAFALTIWISFSMRFKKDRESETNPDRRIVDEFRILTDESWMIDYSKECISKWFARRQINSEREKNLVTTNGELFLHILKRYISTFGTQHTQSDFLYDFFEKRISLNNEEFQVNAKRILVHNIGNVTIVSGSGTFQGIRPTKKKITIKPGEDLKGGIKLRLMVNSVNSNLVPLVEVRTWLSREIRNRGWREIDRNLEKRFDVYDYPEKGELQIDCKGPSKKGIYHLIFAFAEETDCEYVASMTNWRVNYPIWNDYHDITDMTQDQIIQIQKEGHLETTWLKEDGYVPLDLPADAITIEVI